MVNKTFAHEFTIPCKLVSECGIYHFSFLFPPPLDFFFLHHIYPEQISVNVMFCAGSFHGNVKLEIGF